MLFRCNVKSLRCFAFPLLDEAFNRGYDFVNDCLTAFNMNDAVARVRARKPNGLCKRTTIIGASSFQDNITNVGTCTKLLM